MSDPDSIRQTGTIEQFYEALLRSDTYSAENLVRFQDNVLKDLLPFVAKHVPFYRDRLTAAFRKDGSFDPQNWNKIPILSAAEFRANSEELRPTELPASHGSAARYVSSGSTGRPMPFYRSGLSEVAQNAALYRHYRTYKLDPRHNLAMIRVFDPALARSRPIPVDRAKTPWATDWFAGGTPGHILRLTVFTPVAKQVEWLCGLGPVYLNTFPSNALALARYVAKNPGSKPRLLAILTAGEPLPEETRRQCNEYLGCRCIDIYSNAECGLLATDCPVGNVMHVQSELCRVELLGATNKPVRPGNWGRVTITPLYNFAMPLVRYDTGDLARAAPPCSCGRNHMTIARGTGRPSNLFWLPRRKWFRPEFDTAAMEELLGNRRWQLVQTAASAFELRYMPGMSNEPFDAKKTEIAIKRTLGKDASVGIKAVAALGSTSSGKFLTTQNHFHT